MSVEDNLTPKELQDLTTILNTKYSASLRDRYFEISHRREENAVFLTLCLRNEKGSFVYPMETRLKLGETKAKDAALALLDYCDFYFEEFFQEDEAIYLPIDWSDYEYEGLEFQVKGQILNEDLESRANEFLKSSGHQLESE